MISISLFPYCRRDRAPSGVASHPDTVERSAARRLVSLAARVFASAGMRFEFDALRLRSAWLALLSLCLVIAPARAQSGVTAQLQPEDLGNLPGFNSSTVLAVSPDGTVVLGFAFNMGPPNYSPSLTPGQHFRWTAATGPVAIGPVFNEGLPSIHHYHMSDDGSVIVGDFTYFITPSGPPIDHFFWSAATGWTTLPTLPLLGNGYLLFNDVSADGSAAVGSVGRTLHPDQHPPEYESRPFLWTAAAGTVELPLPAGGGYPEPKWVSNDGTKVLGHGPTGLLRWTGNGVETLATDTSSRLSFKDGWVIGDGRVIAGGQAQSNRVWIWDEGSGLQFEPNSDLATTMSLRPDGLGLTFVPSQKSGTNKVDWLEWSPGQGTRLIKQWTLPQFGEEPEGYIPFTGGSGSVLSSAQGSTLLVESYDIDSQVTIVSRSFALQRSTDVLEELVFPPGVSPSHPYYDFVPNDANHLSRDGSVIAANGTIAGDVDGDGYDEPVYRRAYRWVSTSGFVIRDVSRNGNPIAALPGVTVRLTLGSQVFATSTTDAGGRVQFSTEQVDPDELYDVELECNGLRRTYATIRPSEVASGQVKLALPVTLRRLLAAELTKLETTGTLVLPYETAAARTLMEQWNTGFREEHALQASRDEALGRMLSAAESMARIYAVVEPLAKDAGKLLADNLVALLALKKAGAQLGTAVAAEMAASALSERVRAYAVAAILASLKHGTDVAQKALVQGSQAMLPPWGAELVNQSSASIIAGVLGAIASGEWDSAKGKAEGRKKLLDNLAKVLGEQVAGRIMASAHVAQTQQDFDLAVVRARGHQGSGTVAEAYVATLGRAIEAEEKASLVIAQSSLISKTATEFKYVADYADAVGKIPAAQVASMMARLIKVMNLGLMVKAVTDDLATLGDITFEDTPSAAERAFFPSGISAPAPAPRAPRRPPGAPGESPPDDPLPAPLPPDFAAELAAFRGAVVASDTEAALTAGENMLALNDDLEQQMEASLLKVRSRAHSTTPPLPALSDAYGQLQDAVVALRTALAELYPAMAGHIVPQLADPGMTQAGLLALLDTAADAIVAFDNADAAAQAAGAGITAPALVVTLSHGLTGTPDASKTQPGPATLRARVFNAGDVVAEGLVATLGLEPPTGPVPPFVLVSPAATTIGDLAPGQSVDVIWNGTATDVSGSGSGCAVAYSIAIQAGGARAEGAGGAFEVRSPQSGFAEWIGGFGGLGGETGFTDDPDHDGLASGLEKFLGFHPGNPSGPGLRVHSGTGVPYLEHPRSPDFGGDLTASYEWSLDLANWQPSGVSQGSVSVRLDPSVVAGVGGGVKTIRIVPQVTGPADRLFYRVNVTRTAPAPPDPAPTPPEITLPPGALTVEEGQPAALSVTVTGTGPILYQWRKNGVDIVGAIDPTYEIPDADPSDAGIYTVRIVAPGGQLTSPGAELTVNSGGGGF